MDGDEVEGNRTDEIEGVSDTSDKEFRSVLDSRRGGGGEFCRPFSEFCDDLGDESGYSMGQDELKQNV